MVKRYTTEQEPSEIGGWVRHSDYESLESRHRDLVAAARALEKKVLEPFEGKGPNCSIEFKALQEALKEEQ